METILLVEDAQDMAILIRRELEGSGYRVVYAADGYQALDLLSRQPPDLVVLDWMLPGLDGLEVLRRLRASLSVPVLMLTARGDPAERVLGLETGADDYLVKPFSLAELLARVRALFRRAERIRQTLQEDRNPDQSPIAWRGLALDPLSRTCSLDGEELSLTRIEFDLLHLFVRSPGRTFNRIYLLDTVWDVPYLQGDRAVDNTIMRLRRKLGRLEDHLETVRGVGYRLRKEP